MKLKTTTREILWRKTNELFTNTMPSFLFNNYCGAHSKSSNNTKDYLMKNKSLPYT